MKKKTKKQLKKELLEMSMLLIETSSNLREATEVVRRLIKKIKY